ncbi:hypothetical protein AMTR_s00045p00184380 [Amborella trichopoda]|uniref:Uncharacterized protein n=1 Tax=Amborella trichopoda TaxID=13333 RepID=W1P3D2_AMBTC|nr:hypothetical protein AMTR_s00045p00184380 [Amborella trichopoda]
MVVTVPDEEASSIAGSPDQVPNLQVGVLSFDPSIALVRSEGVDPLMVFIPTGVERETVDVVIEETKVASMVRDMGMDFNVAIGMFFEELRHLKAARGSLETSSVAQEAGKVVKEPQSTAGLNPKKPTLKKIPEVILCTLGGLRDHQEDGQAFLGGGEGTDVYRPFRPLC